MVNVSLNLFTIARYIENATYCALPLEDLYSTAASAIARTFSGGTSGSRDS
jgi:hypothetical protein